MKLFYLQIILILSAACGNANSQSKLNGVVTINAAELKELLATQKIQLLDVRTAHEYSQGTINNAQLIDIYDEDFEHKADSALDKTVPVAVFCRSGNRSMTASKLLAKKGYKVYNLGGGIKKWE